LVFVFTNHKLTSFQSHFMTIQPSMKPLKLIASVIVITSFFACEPPVTFMEPQPTNTDNLSKIPKRLQGNFISLADNSTLAITDKLIQRICDFDHKFHSNQLDSNYRLLGDTLVNLTSDEKTVIKRDGDSLVNHIHYIDTLFLMNYDNVVRKFKGYYFLNIRYNESSWEVKKVHLQKGRLIISSISTELDIENLKETIETPNDTVAPYNFIVTKKQFKQFVRNDGFNDSETFVKQR
jgi:hypothetical protein